MHMLVSFAFIPAFSPYTGLSIAILISILISITMLISMSITRLCAKTLDISNRYSRWGAPLLPRAPAGDIHTMDRFRPFNHHTMIV